MGAGWAVSKGSSSEDARRTDRLPSLALPTGHGLESNDHLVEWSSVWGSDDGLRAACGYVLCDRLWLDHGGHLAEWLQEAYGGARYHVAEAHGWWWKVRPIVQRVKKRRFVR